MTHQVFFWLKSSTTADQRAFFEAELKRLPLISYLKAGQVGRPAPTPPRPVTDHSFDYCLHLEFKSMADHDFYQDGCADHKRFVDNCKAFFEKVTVYDSLPLS
jgi:hypothetical protein